MMSKTDLLSLRFSNVRFKACKFELGKPVILGPWTLVAIPSTANEVPCCLTKNLVSCRRMQKDCLSKKSSRIEGKTKMKASDYEGYAGGFPYLSAGIVVEEKLF